MASAAPEVVSLRADRVSVPLETWIAYDDYVRANVAEVEPTNIHGVRCLKTRKNRRPSFNTTPNTGPVEYHITYRDSEFDSLSNAAKRMYRDVFVHMRNQIHVIPAMPSLTTVFQDTDTAHFFPTYLPFWALPLVNKIPSKLIHTWNGAQELFAGRHDALIAETLGPLPSYAEILGRILEKASTKTVCLLNHLTIAGMAHMIANVCWIEDGTLHVGLYDPMMYVRKGQGYLWALTSAYCLWKTICRDTVPVQIHNLSAYCLQTAEEEFHCAQYRIDAEYCQMYSLYFLFLYAKHRCPHTEEGLRAVVRDTFIVPPEELVRNPCEASNRFRLVMIAFIATVILFASPYREDVRDAESMLYLLGTHYMYTPPGGQRGFFSNNGYAALTSNQKAAAETKRGYELIHPNLEGRLNAILDSTELRSRNVSGGSRRRKGSKGSKRALRAKRSRGTKRKH